MLQRIAIPLGTLASKDRAGASRGELLALLLHAVLRIGSDATPLYFAIERVEDVGGVSASSLTQS
jgi:hypothetical protein